MMQAGQVETTDDAFLGGALRLLQPRSGYRAGVDAVLLSAAAPVREDQGARIADLGSGVGTVGLCIARRLARVNVDLVEREPQLAELAAENIARNELSDRVRVITCDLTSGAALDALRPDHYDLVVANPPFYELDRTRASRVPLKATSHAFPQGDLEAWARCMSRIVRPSGMITVVHRAQALDLLLEALSRRFGGLGIVPIYARDDGEPAIRCLLYGTKGSRKPLEVGPGLVLHDDTNAFCEKVSRVLRGPVALDHWPVAGLAGRRPENVASVTGSVSSPIPTEPKQR